MMGPIKPAPFMVNMQNNPDGIFNTYANMQPKKGKENIPDKQPLLKFPITRAILWNRTQIGKAFKLSFSEERRIRMYISDKTLLLASKHGRSQSGSLNSFLIGDFITDSDEGVILQVDRFDPGRNIQIQTDNGPITRKVPTAIIPGDHTISLAFCQNFRKEVVESTSVSNDFQQSIEVLSNRCSKKSLVNVPDMFMSHASFNCQADVNELIVNFKCNVVTFSTQFIAKLINQVPIIPTALAKNLSGPMRLSQVQGNAKFGYLTMDQTRKLLVLLETDPKVESLPLVGIWVSGVEDLGHAYVWACCLKFINASYIKERVLAPPSSFLLVHYPISKAYPDFHECCIESTDRMKTPFTLLTCQDQFIVNMKPDSCDAICMDLYEADDASHSVFNEAAQHWLDKKYPKESPDVVLKSGAVKDVTARNPVQQRSEGELDDDSIPTPRQLPKPHARVNVLQPATPSVPDPSFLEPRLIKPSTNKPYNPRIYQENELNVKQTTIGLSSRSPNDGFAPGGKNGDNARLAQRGSLDRETQSRRQGHVSAEVSSSIRRESSEGSNNADVALRIANNGFTNRTNTPLGSFQLESEPKNSIEGKRILFQGNTPSSNHNFDSELDVSFESVQGASDESKVRAGSNSSGQVLSNQLMKQQQSNVTTTELMKQSQKQDQEIQRPTPKEPNPLSLIAAHEQQLFELQEQIEILLEQKRQEDLRNEEMRRENQRKLSQKSTSVQCSFVDEKPLMTSVSVNTGESLLLLESPKSDLALNGQCCSCCCKCGSTNRPRKSRRSTTTDQNTTKRSSPGSARSNINHVENASVSNQSCNLSDLQTVDLSVGNGLGNTSSMSMQSFASVLEAVDVPVFEDSQNAEPESPNDLVLGESASMIASQQLNQNHTSLAIENESQDEEKGDNCQNIEKEFYQQMVAEVKGFLSDQFENVEDSDGDDGDGDNDGYVNHVNRNASETDETIQVFSKIDRQKMVENATMQQLRVLGADQTQNAEIVDNLVLNQLQSNDPMHLHPRINYVSMLGNEMTDDGENDVADAIAMKYLTKNQFKDVKCSVKQNRTKAVKFEGILHDSMGTPKRGMNYVSMNFSCNMSIATKRYMQRYNLIDSEKDETTSQKGKKIENKILRNINIAGPFDNHGMSSNILDLNKLKQLPKLK